MNQNIEHRKIFITFKVNISSGPIMAFVQQSMQKGFQINQRPDFHEPVYSVVMTVPWTEIENIQNLNIVDTIEPVA